MSRQNDVAVVLEVADEQLARIAEVYSAALRTKEIPAALPVHIKNYLENLRSALDYVAVEIAVTILGRDESDRVYFPIVMKDRLAFDSLVNRDLPRLDKVSLDIYNILESAQAYNTGGLSALATLSSLVNENKHRRLSPQTQARSRSLDLDFGGAAVHLGPGAAISGFGSISSGGRVLDLRGETISGESPARNTQGVKQTVTEWVSFTFSDTGYDVLPLLHKCREEVKRIVDTLALSLWPAH